MRMEAWVGNWKNDFDSVSVASGNGGRVSLPFSRAARYCITATGQGCPTARFARPRRGPTVMRGIFLIRENGRLCSGNHDGCASRWSAPNIMISHHRITLDFDRPSHGSPLEGESPCYDHCAPRRPALPAVGAAWINRRRLNQTEARTSNVAVRIKEIRMIH